MCTSADDDVSVSKHVAADNDAFLKHHFPIRFNIAFHYGAAADPNVLQESRVVVDHRAWLDNAFFAAIEGVL